MWVCTREKPRTQEAFMRHLRDLFTALYIQERPCGRWLALLAEEEAKQIIKTSDPTAPGAPTVQNLHDDEIWKRRRTRRTVSKAHHARCLGQSSRLHPALQYVACAQPPQRRQEELHWQCQQRRDELSAPPR